MRYTVDSTCRKKIKNITVFLFVILYSAQVLGLFEFLSNFLETTSDNITRVRTLKERDRLWRDFAVLDFVGLVEQYDGYTAEEYDVQTEDGYILKLHRITGSPSSPKASGKPPVFIGHGLFLSSDMHVVMGPQQALAFLLADTGYDVWIGNFRGNSYSKRHIKYSTFGNNYEFWNFSMDELSLIDLPLFIDTILSKTNKKRLIYIGYSMGATVSYILLSSKPEYNDKVNVVINIAPAAIFTRPLSHLLSLITILEPPLKALLSSIRIFRVFPQSKFYQILGKDICGTTAGAFICNTLLKLVARTDRVDPKVFPLLLAHIPSGTSLNTVDHYYQLMSSGKFRHFDYGVAINREKYNADTPPEHDLNRITSPQAIFYAEHDITANSRDTEVLKNKLSNVVAFEEAPKYFNHLDFVLHVEARSAVYNRLLEIVAQYS